MMELISEALEKARAAGIAFEASIRGIIDVLES